MTRPQSDQVPTQLPALGDRYEVDLGSAMLAGYVHQIDSFNVWMLYNGAARPTAIPVDVWRAKVADGSVKWVGSVTGATLGAGK